LLGPWLVLGDFNVARAPEDKNTDRFYAASAALFTDTVDEILLQVLPLLDRRFTWSNKREVPTLVCLECSFINAAWGATHFNTTMHSLPRPTSDHSPSRHHLVGRPHVAGFLVREVLGAPPPFCALVKNV
jgi:hypothetical protein